MVNDFFLGDHTIIYDYCHEVLRNNIGSIVKLNVQLVEERIEDIKPHFKGLYICYATCMRVLSCVDMLFVLMDAF